MADCVRDIVNAAAAIDERVSEVYLEQEGSPNNASLTKAHELARFYGEVTGRLMLLDLEITQPEVREHLAIVWKQLEKDSRKLFVARDRGDKDWAAVAERTQALGVDARLRLRELIAVAREYLHEFPGEAAGTSTRSQQS